MQFEAKTLQEAKENGLKELGISENEAEITVIEEPVKGLFGRLKGKAVVDIVKKETIEDLEKTTEEKPAKADKKADAEKGADKKADANDGEEPREMTFLKKVIDLLGIEAEVKLDNSKENETLTLVAEDSASVIGFRGEVLDALQTLTSAVANIGNEKYSKVVVDCENYRDRREETLISLAKKLADKATEIKADVILEPMNPFERRIIHTALADSETVTTKSEGVEPNRYVIIVPNEKDENARPYNAGARHERSNGGRGGHGRGFGGNGHGFNRGGQGHRGAYGRNGGNRGSGFKENYNQGSRSGFSERNGYSHSNSGFTEQRKKTSSGFGTYLGNSLKDKQ